MKNHTGQYFRFLCSPANSTTKPHKTLGSFSVLFALVFCFTIALQNTAYSAINIDLSYSQVYGQTASDEDFQGKGRWATDNTLNDDAFSIGLSGHVYNSKYFGLLLSGKYNYFGRMLGNRNTVCAPEGCQGGKHSAKWMGTMNTVQKTHGGTFGIMTEFKLCGISIMPEGGFFYGKTKLTSHIQEFRGNTVGIVQEKNDITSYYYGARIQYETKYGNIYTGFRQYPNSGGPQMFVNDLTAYEIGISIPIM